MASTQRLETTALNKVARLLKVLGHPIRLAIVDLLELNGDANVNQICKILDQPQPAISQHLAKLREVGLLGCKIEGNCRLYRVQLEQATPLLRCIRLCDTGKLQAQA